MTARAARIAGRPSTGPAGAGWLPANGNRHGVGRSNQDDPKVLCEQLFQLVGSALDGPRGIHPESFVCAFGALAGYSARWIVHQSIEAGRLEDDFRRPAGMTRRAVTVSAHVDRHVHDLTGPSYAAALVPDMIAAGADWLPHINAMIQHNFMAINAPAYPDYTIEDKHRPQVPPQALLLMLWENTLNCLRSVKAEPTVQKALALATVKAAKMHEHRVPLAVSGQLALETAIAMSKLEHGF